MLYIVGASGLTRLPPETTAVSLNGRVKHGHIVGYDGILPPPQYDGGSTRDYIDAYCRNALSRRRAPDVVRELRGAVGGNDVALICDGTWESDLQLSAVALWLFHSGYIIKDLREECQAS